MNRPHFRRGRNAAAPTDDIPVSNEKYHAGDVRQSQLITTFGVGAMVDYVNDTVIIAGTDSWKTDDADDRKIYNENLSSLTDKSYFLKPPCAIKRKAFSHNNDIPSFLFPEKLYCPACHRLYDVHALPSGGDRNKCTDTHCRHQLTPSRFVLVCANGHMEDFPYDWWVHHGKKCSSGLLSPRLRMYNTDNRADMESLIVECMECGEKRRIYPAMLPDGISGYKCNARFPHLNKPDYFSEHGCSEPMKAMHRTSHGVYSPIVVSALSIPPWSREVVKLIGKSYDLLNQIPEQQRIAALRGQLPAHLRRLTDDELQRSWEQLRIRRENHITRQEHAILWDEYSVLCKGDNNDPNDREFASYTAEVPEKYRNLLSQLVIVDRLTEVQALTGFRRTGVFGKPVRLSVKHLDWYPAVELVGEGIFIRFNSDSVKSWVSNIGSRYNEMQNRLNHSPLHASLSGGKFSPQYVLLHTFSHLLIREISAICGYNAASLKEKIYSTYSAAPECEMFGVLIYVSSSDCESSLGGLIGAADDTELFSRLLDSMLNKAMWCSGDPLCISSKEQGAMSLNYSACHNCTLLPETSCEFFNSCLDRAAITGTPDDRELGYFSKVCELPMKDTIIFN